MSRRTNGGPWTWEKPNNDYLDGAELEALRRRYCRHVSAAPLDTMAITSRRGLACMSCGKVFADFTGYELSEGGIYRRVAAGGAS
jgi:hypothetical protein